MTYYAKFTDGPEINTDIVWIEGADQTDLDGFYELSDSDAPQNFYKLENGSPVKISKEDAEVILKGKVLPAQWDSIRFYRNRLLQESDWTQFPNSPLSPEKKIEWDNYRQALRDFPQTLTDPFSVTAESWPVKP